MIGILPVVAIAVFLVAGVFFVTTVLNRDAGATAGSAARSRRGKRRSRAAVIKDAMKRLSQNPKDPEGLSVMGGVYFQEGAWDKAFMAYNALCVSDGAPAPGVDEFTSRLRCGIAALKTGRADDAHKNLSAARALNPASFEANYYLGTLEFQRKNYERAAALLNIARSRNPEHAPTLRWLGHACFKLNKPREAMTHIRKALALAPDDKESLYTLAECCREAGQTEQALRVFSRLLADPVLGPGACLASGLIHIEAKAWDKAAASFELGLRHEDRGGATRLALKYQLALCHLRCGSIAAALPLLREVQAANPDYKDVSGLVSKYQELNANKNLQVYLLGSAAEFASLCRRLAAACFPRAQVKVTSAAAHRNEWLDLTAEVDSARWSDIIMFRFIRSQGAAGELVIRDFHSRLKETKAGKGICVSAGTFTEGARRYTEARLIDLLGKDKLTALLNTLVPAAC
ncbi:MAG: tetratricopeptide repeat protein [Treponematales bacterium]